MNQNKNAASFVISSTCRSVPRFALLVVAIVSVAASPIRAQVPVNTVIATVNVGRQPFGVVVSPDSKFVYVANILDNTVSVIRAKTNKVKTALFAGASPIGLAVSSDGSKLYVSNSTNPGNVTVIDLANGNSTQTITGLGPNPSGLALTPDGKQLWVADAGGDTVDVIDTSNNQVLTPIIVGAPPSYVAFTPDGLKAYVSALHKVVLAIDTASQTVTTSIRVGNAPQGIAITPDGGTAYVLNFHIYTDREAFSVIDTTNDTLIKKNFAGTYGAPGEQPAILSFKGQSYLYFPEYEIGGVAVISTRTNTVVGGFRCPDPDNVVIAPNGTRAYVTNSGNDDVTVVQIQ